MAANKAGAAAAGREFVFTRMVDAPRPDVFEAWTDPQRLSRWWGPNGFTNPVCELDLRPGGAIRIHMRGPDGTVYPMLGTFHEIDPPERLIFGSTALDENGHALFDVVDTVTFTERDGKTEVTVRPSVSRVTPAAAPYLAGMEQGWNESLSRLADYLARG